MSGLELKVCKSNSRKVNGMAVVHSKSSTECIESPDQIKCSTRHALTELTRFPPPLQRSFVKPRTNEDHGRDRLLLAEKLPGSMLLTRL